MNRTITLLTVLIISMILTPIANADYYPYPLVKQWEKRFSTQPDKYEYGRKILETTDNYGNIRYSVVGNKDLPTGRSTWFIILDKNGNVLADKTYIGDPYTMIPTSDKGYLILGTTKTGQYTIRGQITKLNVNGDKQWNKTINPIKSIVYARQTTIDYTLIGYGNRPGDIVFIKTYLNGTQKSQKIISGYMCDGIDIDYSRHEYTIICGAGAPIGTGGNIFYTMIFKLDDYGNIKSTTMMNTTEIYGIGVMKQEAIPFIPTEKPYIPLISMTHTKDGGYILSVNDYSTTSYADMRIIKLKRI